MAQAPAALKQHSIPYFLPTIGEEEIQSVVETLRSGWLTTGPKTKQFEQLFAQKMGAKHAIAVNSCTAALHLALEAIGVGRDDEVLVPTMTFASTAEVVVHLGARPVLVDVLPDTLAIDPNAIESKITSRTKAIMPVHYAGQPAEMDPIVDLARRRGLRVIDDAAHAIPASYKGRMVGTLGEITAFSFYANKTMTTGEGGMITTSDDALADRMRIMSLHGISRDAWKRFSAEGSWFYEITAPGYKDNMTDVASSLGIHQLAKADDFWKARSERAAWYTELLADVPEVATPPLLDHVQHAWHLYVIQVQPERLKINRNQFIEKLNAAGVGTSVHYTPLHMHPYYRDVWGYRPEDLPVAWNAYQKIISLPLYPRLSRTDLEKVVEVIKTICRENRR
ncbi:MAG TPA: UDP-4-amino-4,6-dideoxy-N-acetyl-beta-L-altrosamine transaminase [Planctomycetaceae bacterium]|nr:UDP-4-amino-4,6-dideoxy-N-acetyl-beta-L-altrosamine transaminase [Planctomycetaceae bacterium]